MSPLGRRHGCGEILARKPKARRLGLQSTMRAAALLPALTSDPSPEGEGSEWSGSDDAGPVIPIRRVAHSLRTASENRCRFPWIDCVAS